MQVAVIGGGLFGVTTALSLAEAGIEVDLYEQADRIMPAASWANQWRLHRGYHYPRSDSTALSCRDSAETFTERFPDAVITDTDHYYCIADDRKTKTTGEEFIAFCDKFGLNYREEHPTVVRDDKIDISLRVPENRIDPHSLRSNCQAELAESTVDLRLEQRIEELDDLPHDYVVVATYAGMNDLVDEHDSLKQTYKFELCEKPVVKLPPVFNDKSVVVFDGPFMCFDPYGRTDTFLLGNVVHAIHETTVGYRPDFDDRFDHLLNSGVVESPDITKFQKFVESGGEFIPGLADAEHVGSMYTTRTVLAGVEDTDERPTIVEREGNVFKLLSGKLATCVDTAHEITAVLTAEMD